MILFIQHVDIEGPETLGGFFKKKGFPVKIIALYNGETLPKDLSDLDAVVVLGGPMNVYEEKENPFLKSENAFIQKLLKEQIPYLGICLGSQLLAKACGAKVVKSPQKEIGFDQVRLTKSGQEDLLFKGLKEVLEVYQWHEDMWEVPAKGVLLAGSSGCPHQVFRVGSYAYGIQFHFEITDKSIREWSDHYFQDPHILKTEKQKMLNAYQAIQHPFHQMADTICENFLQVISSRGIPTPASAGKRGRRDKAIL